MTTQITVRLPDDISAFIDEQVARTHVSRSAVISAAISMERKRQRVQSVVEAYRASPEGTDEMLQDWADHGTSVLSELD